MKAWTRDPEYRRKMSEKITREIQIPPLNADFAYFLGSIAGDGSVSKLRESYQIMFVGGRAYCEQIVKLCKRLFNLYAGVGKRKGRTYYRVWISSKRLYDLLIQFFGNPGSLTWRVPDQIIEAENGVKSAFLRGIFDAEGSVGLQRDEKGRIRAQQIKLRLSNKMAIDQLVGMLDSFGIRSPKGAQGKIYYLGIYSHSSIGLFREWIGFSPWALVTKGKDKGMKKAEKLDWVLSTFRGRKIKAWTKDELTTLEEKYDNPADKIKEFFPTRSWCSIDHKMRRLGLSREQWRHRPRWKK